MALPTSFELKTTEPNGLAVVAVIGDLDAPTRAVSRIIECTHLDKVLTVVSGAKRCSS